MTDYTKLTDSEIDRLVAERIRKWHKTRMSSQGLSFPVWADNKTGEFECDGDAYHPSRDLNQAREAVERYNHPIDIWFSAGSWKICGENDLHPTTTDNPARAICIALLEAEEGK